MSWVFLTDRHVYKLKKPVRHDFLDFSTLQARRRNCLRELRLNRRLAKGVYRRVLPLVRLADGHLRLGGKGRVVDWLVEMRRLPAQRMLDAAIAGHAVNEDNITRLNGLLAAFYRRSKPVAMRPAAYVRRYLDGIRHDRDELARPAYRLPAWRIDRIAAAQQRFVDANRDLLAERVRAGKIVDAHGDLRPEHVCLTMPPCIIDCLEFNRSFRLLDPADELAYLAMECERLGAAEVGERILRGCLTAAADAAPEPLIRFYKSYRASLRARIAIWHIADHEVMDTRKWRRRALDYLDLAERYATLL